MPLKMSQTVVNADLRSRIFDMLHVDDVEGCAKVSDSKYGIILTDMQGHERYVRVSLIVAKEDDGKTAQEMFDEEHNKYLESVKKAQERAKSSAEKAAKDKAKREAAKKKKEEEEAAKEEEEGGD